MVVILISIICVVTLRYRWHHPGAHLVFASGQDGGVYVELADEFHSIIEKELPDVSVQLQPTAGSVENVNLIESGAAQLALVQNDIPGTAALRTIAPLHSDYLHILVRKEAQITGLRDLSGKTVTTGLYGSGSLPVVQALLKYFQLKDTTVHQLSVSDGLQQLTTGETDALILMLGFRAPAIIDLFASEHASDLEFLTLPSTELQALEGFVLAYPFCRTIDLPPYSYGAAPSSPTPTLAIQTLLVAHRDVSPRLIKPITEVLFTHRADLIRREPAIAQMSEEFSTATISFPIHEGARQYFSRDEPGFIIRYAEMLAFLLSLLIALYGLFRAARKWVEQRQKDRIDDYYLRVDENLERLQAPDQLDQEQLEAISLEIKAIRHEAFQQLANEQLNADTAFRILQHLLDQCEAELDKLNQSKG